MKQHDTFAKKISLWLDEELSQAEITELQNHLAQCPLCRQTHRAMQQVDTLLRSASAFMVSPGPGFRTRLQARLATYPARSSKYTWLGLGSLLLGSLFFITLGLIIGGLALINFTSLIDLSPFMNWLINLGQLFNQLYVWLNLGNLFLKVALLTMKQPLFWGYALVAMTLAWLWLRLIRGAYRRLPATL